MRYSPFIVDKAKKLRSEGVSYREIGVKLGINIPKATLAHWCRGITLPLDFIRARRQSQLEHLQLARNLSVQQKRRVSIEQLKTITENSQRLVKQLQSREIFLLALAMLYLGEGAKAAGHSGLMLGSSDPNIIRLYIALLRSCYAIDTNDLHCRISYRADQNIRALEQYWSNVTAIPLAHFYKTKPDQRTVGKSTKRPGYRGVCVISCRGRKHQLELHQISLEFLQSIVGR